MSTTITSLDCPNGSKVHIVGTIHFSKESVEDVRRTITQHNPRCVVLEVCGDRRIIFQYSKEDILREARSVTFEKLRSFIRRDGVVAGITQSMFLKLTAELTQQLGVAPGEEFRAGYEEARKIGADVILGDRLVGITFKRLLASLSLWNKLRLTFSLLQALGNNQITIEQIEELKSRDMVQILMGELGAQFPEVSEVFVNERDRILAYSLMKAANCAEEPYGPPVTVVGVMGLGHVRGVCSKWMAVGDIRPLMSTPRPSRTSLVVWSGLKFSFRLGIFVCSVSAMYFLGRKIKLW